MCTVTFIPAGDKVFITHSRDEQKRRPRALAPAVYRINGHELLFPRDAQAGGTWMAVNAYGAAAVLLNGAFEKHVSRPPYRKSRGLALLDIIASDDAPAGWQRAELEGIEPFTLILWSHEKLYEGRWDGRQKHTRMPDCRQAHTWSSVTLYDETVRSRRQQWFDRWRALCPRPAPEEILHYHLSGGEGDVRNDLRMNRDDTMLTVGITALTLSAGGSRMTWLDLQDDRVYTNDFMFSASPSPKNLCNV